MKNKLFILTGLLLLFLTSCELYTLDDLKSLGDLDYADGGSCTRTVYLGNNSVDVCESVNSKDYAEVLEANCSGSYSENACSLSGIVGICEYESGDFTFTLEYGPEATSDAAKASCDGYSGTYTSIINEELVIATSSCTDKTDEKIKCYGYEKATSKIITEMESNCFLDGFTVNDSTCDISDLLGTCRMTTSDNYIVNIQYGKGYEQETDSVTLGEAQCSIYSGIWTAAP